MRIPVWLTLGVAILVCSFGLYRMRMALRSDALDPAAPPRKGLYGMRRRTHLLIGIIYLLLGGALIATSFGWNPFAGMFGPSTQPPTKANLPTKTGGPIDELPATKGSKP
jgi:hypothetical protein